MAWGPSNYDGIAEALIQSTEAEAVLLIVVRGKLGSGCANKCRREFAKHWPDLLRTIADEVEKDFKELPPP